MGGERGREAAILSAPLRSSSPAQDAINWGFLGLCEDDYEWVTRQLLKVANATAGGRVVSVLEGGYRIHGRVVSAFGRSVAAHVRALASGCREAWDTDRERVRRWRPGYLDGEASRSLAVSTLDASLAGVAQARNPRRGRAGVGQGRCRGGCRARSEQGGFCCCRRRRHAEA